MLIDNLIVMSDAVMRGLNSLHFKSHLTHSCEADRIIFSTSEENAPNWLLHLWFLIPQRLLFDIRRQLLEKIKEMTFVFVMLSGVSTVDLSNTTLCLRFQYQ